MKSYTRVSRKTVGEDRIAICPNFGCEYMKRVKPLKFRFIGFGKYPKCRTHHVPLVYTNERIVEFVDAALACLFDKGGLPPKELIESLYSKYPDNFRSFIEDWVYCITIGRGARIVSRYMDTISNAYLKQLTKKQIKALKKGVDSQSNLVNKAIKDGMDEISIQYTRILKHLRVHSEILVDYQKLKSLSISLQNFLKDWQKQVLNHNEIMNSPERERQMTLQEIKRNYDQILNIGTSRCLLGLNPESKEIKKAGITAFDRFSAYFEFLGTGITSKFNKSDINNIISESKLKNHHNPDIDKSQNGLNNINGSFFKDQDISSENLQEQNGFCLQMDELNNKKMTQSKDKISVADKEKIYSAINEEIKCFKKGLKPRPLAHIWRESFQNVMSQRYFQKIVKKKYPLIYEKIWSKKVQNPNELSGEMEIKIKNRLELEFNKTDTESLNQISTDLGISLNALKCRIFEHLSDLYGDDEQTILREYQKRWMDPKSELAKEKQFERIKDIITSKEGILLSKTYTNKSIPLDITCKYGHFFSIKPEHLLRGSWCNKCFLEYKKEKATLNLREVIESKGGKLLSEYINAKTKVDIQCNKNHTWSALPDNIKQGYWCPYCSNGKGERIIRWYFEQIFSYILKKSTKFPTKMICDVLKCTNIVNIPNKFKELHIELMHFDGYSEILFNNVHYKIAIEYNGIQHYIFPNWYHKNTPEGYEMFQLRKLRDEFRRWICGQTNIILFEFPYDVDERMRHPTKIQRFIINELRNKFNIRFDNVPLFKHKFLI
ncbi:MAG: hypothetical protein EU533_03595 [Promethearchaeota archaeon]|nr:MAG: hypothetical protein EU533_03595 [Candidatus Lokiarchaeota archaeon]